MSVPLRSSVVVSSGASGGSVTVTLPSGIVNDDTVTIALLQDIGGTAIAQRAGTTGWTIRQPTGVTGGVRLCLAYKVCAAGEANPQFDGAASGAWLALAWINKDCDVTTPINTTSGQGYASTDFANTSTASNGDLGAGLTPAAGDDDNGPVTLIYMWGLNGNAKYMRAPQDDLVEIGKAIDPTGLSRQGNIIVGYRVMGATDGATAAPTVRMYSTDATQGGNGFVFALRNKSGGSVAADCRTGLIEQPDSAAANWYGDFGAAVTSTAPSNFAATLLGGTLTVRTTKATESTAAGSVLPWGRYTTLADSTASVIVGRQEEITPTNLAGKIAHVNFYCGSGSQSTNIDTHGLLLGFKDSAGAYVVYQLAPRSALVANAEQSAQIALGYATAWDSSGTIDWTDVKYYLHGAHHGASATALTWGIKNLAFVGPAVITGGSAALPASFTTLSSAQQSWGYGAGSTYTLAQLQASAQVMAKGSVTIGDGSTPTYFKASKQSFAYPLAWDGVTQTAWNVQANRVALATNGLSTDTIMLTAFSAVTTVEQDFTLGGSAAATYGWAGGTFVGFNCTMNADIDPTGATWEDCPLEDGKAATYTSCYWTGGTDTAQIKLDDGGKLLTSVLTAGGSAIYGLRITAAGSYYINGSTFSGFTKDIDITAASGAVIIYKESSDATPTYQTAGATVTISAPPVTQSVAITGLAPTYRLQIFDIEYDLTVSGVTVTPTAGATYTHNGITWTVRAASIVAGSGTVTLYGTGTPAASGTLTKASGTGDASITFSAYAVDGTELYIGVPAATSYTWTDSVAAAAPRVIRVRVMEDGPGTSDAILMVDAIVGMCGLTAGAESVGYLVAAVADDIYNDRGVDGSTVTGIVIDDSTLRLTISSGTVTNYNGTDVLVIDGRDIYAYETYWLGTTAGMRDEARFIEAVDAVNFRCSNFKLLGASGYPILIRNCYMVDSSTGIFASLVDYSGDPISNAPDHMAAIVVSTSDAVISGTAAEIIAAIPSATITRTEKLLRNKMITDPATGVLTIYDDDGTTPLVSGDIFEDAAGSQPYRGQGAERRERLT